MAKFPFLQMLSLVGGGFPVWFGLDSVRLGATNQHTVFFRMIAAGWEKGAFGERLARVPVEAAAIGISLASDSAEQSYGGHSGTNHKIDGQNVLEAFYPIGVKGICFSNSITRK